MDMSEVVDSDFGMILQTVNFTTEKYVWSCNYSYVVFFYVDQRLDTLKELKAQWKKLQSDIHSPIKESSLFLQATAVLSRYSNCFFLP